MPNSFRDIIVLLIFWRLVFNWLWNDDYHNHHMLDPLNTQDFSSITLSTQDMTYPQRCSDSLWQCPSCVCVCTHAHVCGGEGAQSNSLLTDHKMTLLFLAQNFTIRDRQCSLPQSFMAWNKAIAGVIVQSCLVKHKCVLFWHIPAYLENGRHEIIVCLHQMLL